MRKWLLSLVVLSFFLAPISVSAQSDLNIKKLSIQFWPEYDRPEMLVMYSFELAEDTPLPAELHVRIPINAEINAVAKFSEGKMLTVPYDTPVRDGDWVIITLVIDELTNYRVEYYAPLEKNGANRAFSFLWENDSAIKSLFVEVQQPASAKKLIITPTLPETRVEELTYHTLLAGGVNAGEIFTLDISYEKDDDNLTVSSMPIEVGGAPENVSNSFSLNDSLPTILVGVGVFLIVGGFLYFFFAGRNNDIAKDSRKRHVPRSASAGGNIYCHECGSRARSGDRFCRACGAKLRV